MRYLPPLGGMLLTSAFFAVCAGCERTPQTPAPPAATAPTTQPSADELATIRRSVQEKQQQNQAMGALPAGHPPIDGSAARQPMPMGMNRPAVTPVNYAAPTAWQKEQPRSNMRSDQYRLPRAEGDAEDGELAVFPGLGGGVDANIDRWKGQFSTPEGQPIPPEAFIRQTLDVNGLKVTFVDIAGRYDPGMMAGGSGGPKQGFRMLGAVVETPEGEVYFKATGPSTTMANQRDAFLEFLKTMKRATSGATTAPAVPAGHP
jgi:hypothetical protein